MLRWLEWAGNDYIAARLLFLNNLLVQGSGLSNTTIEKYLKTLYFFTIYNFQEVMKAMMYAFFMKS